MKYLALIFVSAFLGCTTAPACVEYSNARVNKAIDLTVNMCANYACRICREQQKKELEDSIPGQPQITPEPNITPYEDNSKSNPNSYKF